MEDAFEVEARLEGLKETILGLVEAEPKTKEEEKEEEEEERTREVRERRNLVFQEAVEECQRLWDQHLRYKAQIQVLEKAKVNVEAKIETVQKRVRAFERRSGVFPADEKEDQLSSSSSASSSSPETFLVSGMKPEELVLTLAEKVRTQADFEGFRAVLDREIDSSTMEKLHLMKRLSSVESRFKEAAAAGL